MQKTGHWHLSPFLIFKYKLYDIMLLYNMYIIITLEDESLARRLQRSEIFESNQSWIRVSPRVASVPKAPSSEAKIASKPQQSRERPSSPTHVFLTPFQEATPKSPCRSSSEKLKPSESAVRRRSSSFKHPRSRSVKYNYIYNFEKFGRYFMYRYRYKYWDFWNRVGGTLV